MDAYDDGYDDYEDGYAEEYADEQPQAYARRPPRRAMGGATPLGAGLAGLLIGALLAAIGLVAIGGNPFSDANDVTYREIVVADVSEAGDEICWSKDPGRRGADRACAILAIDPAAAPPEPGERVTVGLVTLRPPDGAAIQQVVYVRGAAPAAPESGGDESPEDDSSGAEDASGEDENAGDGESGGDGETALEEEEAQEA